MEQGGSGSGAPARPDTKTRTANDAGDDRRPRITVVGLGPADDAYLTGHVAALMEGAAHTFVRTARHPAAQDLTGVEALDRLYETAETFDEVYRSIVEEVVAAAIRLAPDPVVYAVPGSPLVAERTVELLRRDARIDLTVVPAMSFLDLAWERLGIDPINEGVRLVDAEQYSELAAGDAGPLLVAQCWSHAVLSDIKLSVPHDNEMAGREVVLLHHLGLDDERVLRVGWWELDRTITPDHLTSLFIPGTTAPQAGSEMARLEALVLTLRAQCPWDRSQTHASLMPHLIEESYEVLDALAAFDPDGAPAASETAPSPAMHLREELGDLLFQIVFHACLAQEEGYFDLDDVARGVHQKLVHRHPHVFGDVRADSADQVVANWEDIKKLEKGRTSVTEGIPSGLPALLLSTKLQRKALSVGMTLPAPTDAGVHLLEQLVARQAPPPPQDVAASDAPLVSDGSSIERLVGELLFGVVDLCRRQGIDPEQALRTKALSFRDEVVAQETATSAAEN